MMKSFYIQNLRFIIGGTFFLCIVVGYSLWSIVDAQYTRLIFLDVGQGDAILLQAGSNQVLIDGGSDGSLLLNELAKFMPFWDRNIEMVIATHPDQDHIGGLLTLSDRYTIESVMQTGFVHDSTLAQLWREYVATSGVHVVEGRRNTHVSFPQGGSFSVYYPSERIDATSHLDSNDTSITGVFTYGSTRFVLTGDLSAEYEESLGIGKAQALKAGHHGSNTSTSEKFLEEVRPKDIIISAGENNRYGHPHEDVLWRARKHNAHVYRTDQLGSIEYLCSATTNSCSIP
jgi:competence protein ComEC